MAMNVPFVAFGVIEKAREDVKEGRPRYIITVKCSDTDLDLQNDRINPQVLEKARKKAAEGQIDLLRAHRDGIEIGRSCGFVVDPDDPHALVLEFELDETMPEAMKLWREIKEGRCVRQASIGGRIVEAMPVWDARYQRRIRYIADADIDHVAVCRAGHAANPRTAFLGAMLKALEESAEWQAKYAELTSDEWVYDESVGLVPRTSYQQAVQGSDEASGVTIRKGGKGAMTAEMEKERKEPRWRINTDIYDIPAHEDKDREWDRDAAEERVRRWATDENGEVNWERYRKAFLVYDAANPELFGSYKLPVVDIIDDEPRIIWRALSAVNVVLAGGRRKPDLPADIIDRLEGVVAKLRKKWKEEEAEKEVEAPSYTIDDFWADWELCEGQSRSEVPTASQIKAMMNRARRYGYEPATCALASKPLFATGVTEKHFADPVGYLFPMHTPGRATVYLQVWRDNLPMWLQRYPLESAVKVYERIVRKALEEGPVVYDGASLDPFLPEDVVSRMEGYSETAHSIFKDLWQTKLSYDELLASGWLAVPMEKALTAEEKEKALKELKAREKKYGYKAAPNAHLIKPSEYAHIPESQFADPVGYNYPIDEEHVAAAIRYFLKPANRSVYEPKAQVIIYERILRAMKKYGLKHRFNPDNPLDWLVDRKLKEWMEGYEDYEEEDTEERRQKAWRELGGGEVEKVLTSESVPSVPFVIGKVTREHPAVTIVPGTKKYLRALKDAKAAAVAQRAARLAKHECEGKVTVKVDDDTVVAECTKCGELFKYFRVNGVWSTEVELPHEPMVIEKRAIFADFEDELREKIAPVEGQSPDAIHIDAISSLYVVYSYFDKEKNDRIMRARPYWFESGELIVGPSAIDVKRAYVPATDKGIALSVCAVLDEIAARGAVPAQWLEECQAILVACPEPMEDSTD